MDNAKIIFLGTGSAIPTKKHNHPAMLIQFKGENILVDCGEGTQRQFRIANLNVCKITKILITHWHADHILGIPGLLQTLMLSGYNKKLEIYGPKGTKKMMQIYQSLFVPKEKSNKINIEIREVNGKFIETEDFILEAKPMKHGTPSLAYSFTIKEKTRINKSKIKGIKLPDSPLIAKLKKGQTIKIGDLKINGKKVIYKEPSRKVTFIMDTSINSNCKKIAKNSDILISESTFSIDAEELAKSHMHLTSGQAAKIAKQSKAKKLILTHLSQRHEKDSAEILRQAKRIFKNAEVANDFDIVEF